MKTISTLLFIAAAIAPVGLHAENPDPRGLIEAAARASKEVRSASYHARFVSWNSATDFGMSAGDVRVERFAEGKDLKARISMDVATSGSAGSSVRQSLVFDGAALNITNPGALKVTTVEAALNPSRFITSGPIGRLVVTPMIMEEPFKQTLANARNLKYEGTEKIEGVDCHVVSFSFDGDQNFSDVRNRVYIGVEDKLMRQSVGSSVYNNQQRRDTLTISKLATNIFHPADAFSLSIPNGYTAEKYVEPERPKPLEAGVLAPEWTLTGKDGKAISLSDFKGKVVLLDFWGTWCGPCVRSTPVIQKIHERFKDRGVAVVGISCREPASADPAAFMAKRGLTYGLALNGTEIARKYNIPGYPTLFLIGLDGKIVHNEVGFDPDNTETQLTEVIETYLKSQGM